MLPTLKARRPHHGRSPTSRVAALIVHERDIDRQLAFRKGRDIGDGLAQRADDGRKARVGRANQEPPVFDGTEDGDQMVLVGGGRTAEPGVVGQVDEQLGSSPRRVASGAVTVSS